MYEHVAYIGSEALNFDERGYFDTFPVDDRNDFFGAWGAFPFFGDGKVVVTSSDEGVFVLDSRAKEFEQPVRARPKPLILADQRGDWHVARISGGESSLSSVRSRGVGRRSPVSARIWSLAATQRFRRTRRRVGCRRVVVVGSQRQVTRPEARKLVMRQAPSP